MASSNLTLHDVLAAKPDMDTPLPPAPDVVQAHQAILKVWLFVNACYKQLEGPEASQRHLRNKIRRATAPGLLLGLQMIKAYSFARMKELSPGTIASGKRPDDETLLAWGAVIMMVMTRVQRWTADTSKQKLRASDPNNNHTILEIMNHYQREQKRWWLLMAADSIRTGKFALQKYYTGEFKVIPFQFLSPDDRNVDGNHRYLSDMLEMLSEYVALTPGAQELVPFNIKGMTKDMEKDLRKYRRAMELDV